MELTCIMTPLSPLLLECLAAIVEEGGFERAARRLSITQSAVSQRLQAMEAQIGAVLIVRGKPLRPTPAGRLLLKHAMQVRLLHADLQQDLQQLGKGTPNAVIGDERIAIAVNADSIATWALPAFSGLVRDGLPLEIITDDQDFTHDWLREGEVLGCVTTLKRALRGCKVVALGAMDYIAVATPETAEKSCPGGLTTHSVRQLPFIAFNRKDDLQSEFVCRALKLRQINLRHRFVPSSEGQVRAVLAGWGASVVPELLVHPLIANGTLVSLCPQFHLAVVLYWHCWNLDSTVLNTLSKAIIDAATSVLKPCVQEKPSCAGNSFD